MARSGYINLLQPQDRRSNQAGDSAAAVAARRRIHDRGVTAPLGEAVAEMLAPSAGDRILDAGCGDGFYLGLIFSKFGGLECTGVDISVPAVEAAAKRYPGCEWVVANADRQIPYADGQFTAVMSITARQNSVEFCRILSDSGRLLVAIPAEDDLIELRGRGRDRVDRTVETFAPHFQLKERRRATTTADLEVEAVEDILLSIYRPMQAEPARAQQVTFSLDLLLFGK